jgi:glycosyltransferase involved in cell wall biosynthesis
VKTRPPVLVLGWTSNVGRAADLAAALGGKAQTYNALRIVHPAAIPLRLSHTPLVLDSHPSAFGLQGDRLSGRTLPLHAWLSRRAATTLVSAPSLVEMVRRWGGRADVLHEAPPNWQAAPPKLRQRPRVLFPGIYAADEPVDEVVAAARDVPSVDILITGDLRKRPGRLADAAPENVYFVGFLHSDDYRRALAESDAVLSLTTEPTSVMRTAHEAVWAGRPLIVTDRPDLRELFPAAAIYVANEASAIADGLRALRRGQVALLAEAPRQRAIQTARCEKQLSILRSLLAIAAPDAGGAPEREWCDHGAMSPQVTGRSCRWK